MDEKRHEQLGILTQGQMGGFSPVAIPKTACASAVNVTFRTGHIAQRPPFREIALTFEDATSERIFKTGKFQGGAFYDWATAGFYVCVISGTVYQIDLSANVAYNRSKTVGNLSQLADRCYFCQTAEYFIVQDGINPGVIIGPANTVRAVPSNATTANIPIGTVMGYAHGRLFVKTSPLYFEAGDLYLPNDPANVLNFTETAYLETGGALAVPANLGEIMALRPIANAESGEGFGPLIALCANGAAGFFVNQPRDDWTTADLARVLYQGAGLAACQGSVNWNADIFFRSTDGIRTLGMTTTQLEGSGLNQPNTISEGVDNWLAAETDWLISLVSMDIFDDRLLVTTNGRIVGAFTRTGDEIDDYAFGGLLALDLHPRSVPTERRHAWEGLWSGVSPLGVTTCRTPFSDRCVLPVKGNGEIKLYELMKKGRVDRIDTPITSQVIFRGMDFNFPADAKNFDQADLRLSDLWGPVTIDLLIQPDNLHWPVPVARRVLCALTEPETDLEDLFPQTRPNLIFPKARELYHPILKNRIDSGFLFQFGFRWTGSLQLDDAVFIATVAPTTPQNHDDETCEGLVTAVQTLAGQQQGLSGTPDDFIDTTDIPWDPYTDDAIVDDGGDGADTDPPPDPAVAGILMRWIVPWIFNPWMTKWESLAPYAQLVPDGDATADDALVFADPPCSALRYGAKVDYTEIESANPNWTPPTTMPLLECLSPDLTGDTPGPYPSWIGSRHLDFSQGWVVAIARFTANCAGTPYWEAGVVETRAVKRDLLNWVFSDTEEEVPDENTEAYDGNTQALRYGKVISADEDNFDPTEYVSTASPALTPKCLSTTDILYRAIKERQEASGITHAWSAGNPAYEQYLIADDPATYTYTLTQLQNYVSYLLDRQFWIDGAYTGGALPIRVISNAPYDYHDEDTLLAFVKSLISTKHTPTAYATWRDTDSTEQLETQDNTIDRTPCSTSLYSDACAAALSAYGLATPTETASSGLLNIGWINWTLDYGYGSIYHDEAHARALLREPRYEASGLPNPSLTRTARLFIEPLSGYSWPGSVTVEFNDGGLGFTADEYNLVKSSSLATANYDSGYLLGAFSMPAAPACAVYPGAGYGYTLQKGFALYMAQGLLVLDWSFTDV